MQLMVSVEYINCPSERFMAHQFRISVQPLEAGEQVGTALQFDVSNHDDILSVVEKARTRAPVPSEQIAAFTVGLKLFTEVMLAHRETPLFAPLFPHVAAFMKRLKAMPQNGDEG
ncbi:DUF3861 domain-containing protein [Novosphingobium lindaniclasticum]|jgi:hypothetical protein|uniref:DUF3861 domain-containing protein n=1 Tax=Novosphingobium lindaniclasticum TaxID=1329895 RepID=UPI0024095962|nr:DUF3861 domain-containing protein [Novosphingobium lindaniclasticum]